MWSYARHNRSLLTVGGTLLAYALASTMVLAADAPEPSKYTGPGSCSAPACHGGVVDRDQTSVLQNEYSTWVVRDKHAHAFTVLSNDVATRMAKIMGLQKADTEKRCLACHALDVPPEQRARTFDLSDGVGCENCHGPASAWLGKHTERDWNYDKSVGLGMYPTRDLVKRTEKCLTCHLGTPDKTVDHELIAAGHPDLYFELDSFMSVMPNHWKEADKDPWLLVRAVAVGQAVQLREQLRRVARESQGGIWPEYAELDCFACHHSLTAAKDSWRLKVAADEGGYPNRRPGNPAFNMSRYVVFRRTIQEADSGGAQQLQSEVGQVYRLVTALGTDRRQVASQASNAAEAADRMAQRLNSMKFDQDMTLRLMKSISSDAAQIADQGERAAEQATMVLNSLFVAYTKNNGRLANEQQIRAALNGLFQQLDNPSNYNGPQFTQAMRSLNALF